MFTYCIAEDEYYVQKSIEGRVRAMNLGLSCAGAAFTGDDALALYDEVKPDLFFVDINMPQISGIEFIERVRRHDPESRTLFIIISGYSDYKHMHRAIRADVFDYLQKPIVPSEFSTMMHRALANLQAAAAADGNLPQTDTGSMEKPGSSYGPAFIGDGPSVTGPAFRREESFVAGPAFRGGGPSVPGPGNRDDTDTASGEVRPPAQEEIPQERIRRICEFIRQHYREEISVGMLAEEFYLSPSYISHIFKDQMGTTLGKYVEDIRMGQAFALLRNTSLRVQEIAEMTGYKDGNYFAKCFRRKYNMAPSEVRRE